MEITAMEIPWKFEIPLKFKPKLERAEAEAREVVETDAEAENRRSDNEDAERERERERERKAEKAGKVRRPENESEWSRQSDTSNESQLLELVYEERGDVHGELSPKTSQHLVPRAQRARSTRLQGCIASAHT